MALIERISDLEKRASEAENRATAAENRALEAGERVSRLERGLKAMEDETLQMRGNTLALHRKIRSVSLGVTNKFRAAEILAVRLGNEQKSVRDSNVAQNKRLNNVRRAMAAGNWGVYRRADELEERLDLVDGQIKILSGLLLEEKENANKGEMSRNTIMTSCV